MIDLSQLQRDYAAYLPAISKGYAEAVVKPLRREAPVAETDLDFFNRDTTLFHLPAAVYSAGQAGIPTRRTCSVYERSRADTLVLGDSGGYQMIKGNLKIGGKTVRKPRDKERNLILGWLEEHCDWAMTLDVPIDALKFPNSGHKKFSACLARTECHLMHFQKERQGRVKFLNCLHGRTKAECELWYNAVRDYCFEGWAFGSGHKENPYLILHRLLCMRDDGGLDGKERFHFLGQSGLQIACILSAIQRALREHINADVIVTYDTSSPFTTQAEYAKVYTGYTLTPRRFSIMQENLPDSESYVGSDIPFPWKSPIGERLTMGDLCVKKGGARTWDSLTDHMVMNHNVFVQMDAIIAANRVFELETADAKNHCPASLLEIRELIAKAFTTERWDTLLTRHRQLLQLKSNDFTDGLGVNGDF